MTEATPENVQNIMLSLMAESMQCWLLFDEEIHGYVVTTIAADTITREKTLNIYTLFLYKSLGNTRVWKDCVYELNKFAKANGCKAITAYTVNEKVASIANKVGFKTDVFLTREV
jgi:hypothetical protein